MTTLSIRGLDDKTARILKDHARRGGKSVNIQVVELIRKGLGLAAPEAGSPGHTDLDHLAGTWTAEEAKAFARRRRPSCPDAGEDDHRRGGWGGP